LKREGRRWRNTKSTVRATSLNKSTATSLQSEGEVIDKEHWDEGWARGEKKDGGEVLGLPRKEPKLEVSVKDRPAETLDRAQEGRWRWSMAGATQGLRASEGRRVGENEEVTGLAHGETS
jgi:hypothetical protein